MGENTKSNFDFLLKIVIAEGIEPPRGCYPIRLMKPSSTITIQTLEPLAGFEPASSAFVARHSVRTELQGQNYILRKVSTNKIRQTIPGILGLSAHI